MATVLRDFTYFDREFTKGEKVDDDDPAVALIPQMFKQSAKRAPKTKKERP